MTMLSSIKAYESVFGANRHELSDLSIEVEGAGGDLTVKISLRQPQ
jgi:hypothetical protein